MTLQDHIIHIMRDKAPLDELKNEMASNPALAEEVKHAHSLIDVSVLDRCWITRQRFNILTRALGYN